MDIYAVVQDALDYIEQHLKNNEISVESIAKRSGISIWHFQRLFQQLTCETIGSYLRKRRLSRSLDELLHSDLRVIDIALQYGFSSSEAYSRAFKQMFGFSPADFRKKRPKIVPEKLALLDKNRYEHFTKGIRTEPVIAEVGPMLVVGFMENFLSPLADRMQYINQVKLLWQHFFAHELIVPHAIGRSLIGVGDGVVKPSQVSLQDGMMCYLAGLEVARVDQVPVGMKALEIERARYAIFRYQGYHEQTQYIIDYIYGTWLPRSPYKRSKFLPEFTRLDLSSQELSPTASWLDYYVPLEPS